MLIGTGFSITVTAFIILTIWLYNIINHEEALVRNVIHIRTIADLRPPPSLAPAKPKVNISKPKFAAYDIGIPTPVHEDELDEEDPMIASRWELQEINTPSLLGNNDDLDTEIIIDIPDEELIPPDSFVVLEIEPVQIYEELPEYPRLAQEGGFTGWVLIQAFIDKNGDVKKAQAVKTNRPKMGFEEAAIKAAYKCKYRPAIQNGEPIGVWIAYRVKFTLE
jgi:protein TonB